MDKTVLYNLTYGLYVVGAFIDGKAAGCVVNTCFQLTSERPLLAVSVNKQNYTLAAIEASRRFSLSIIAEDTDPSIIGRFGFMSSRSVDKYAETGFDVIGFTPCVRGRFAGRLILEVEQAIDCETHMLVIARLADTVPGDGKPMTYAYYHDVIKGKAPASAPTYRADDEAAKAEENQAKRRYECDICGYIAEVDGELPDNYECPLCGADRTHFKEI